MRSVVPRLLRVLLLVIVVLAPSLGVPPAGGDELRPASGVWPLSPRPRVVAGFEPPVTRWGRGHRGVDLAGSPGQVVRSTLPGTVVFAGRIAGRGVVVVDHGAARTTYEPVAAAVRVRDRVGAGAMLGHLELVGSHCFPAWCLHWGYIDGHEHYLDPLLLVGDAPVVLLPQFGPASPDASPMLGRLGSQAAPALGPAGPNGDAGTDAAGTRQGRRGQVHPVIGVMRLGPPLRAALMLGLPGTSWATSLEGVVRLVGGPGGRPDGVGRW